MRRRERSIKDTGSQRRQSKVQEFNVVIVKVVVVFLAVDELVVVILVVVKECMIS